MAKSKNYVAVDLGAESGRVVLGTIAGDGRISLREVRRFPNGPLQTRDGLFWDFERIAAEVERGMEACISTCPVIDGIGVDSWGVDFGLLDQEGKLLANPRHYRDPSNAAAMRQVHEIIPKDDLYLRTGIQLLPFNTLYQLYGLSLRSPDLMQAASRLLMIPDLVNHRLSGSDKGEYTIASTSQMLDPFTRSWAVDLLRKLGLRTDILPEIVEPGAFLGEHSGIPVIATCCHDTASAVAGVPMESPDALYISCGTWAVVGVVVPEPVINDLTLRHNFTNEGGYQAIRLLRNVTGLWLVQQCRSEWEAEGRTYTYDELTRLARASEHFRSIIDPDSPEFLEPGPMTHRIAAYCGRTNQPVPEWPGEFVRTALESIALRIRWTVDRLSEILGRGLDMAHIVGGGSRNPLLCQLVADALGMPVTAGPVEATCAGNILVIGLATGVYSTLAEARSAVSRSLDLVRYDPRDTVGSAYERFLALVTS